MLRRALLSMALVAGVVPAQTSTSSADLYEKTIQPILSSNCLGCHNSKVKQGGLDLSTRDALLQGSEHGKVVVLGNSNDSVLYKVVAHITDPGMPFKGKKLPDASIAAISEWIKAGVPYGDAAGKAEVSIAAEAPSTGHFAFLFVPQVPAIKDPRWSRNPIDAFIAAEHAKRGITPVGEADKRTLIRRVYLDLIGLPPTPEEIRQFETDKNPAAYDKIVDRLLASPRYGERWGRHWLDIWRYSDWYGWRIQNQVRYSQRHIWRWRDWTIESLNQNKPYDADDRGDARRRRTRARQSRRRSRHRLSWRRNWYMFNRNVWLQDTVEYTSAAFLGLTMKCARCHTHKYDPIPHDDYYRFRAFFEPHDVRTDRVPGRSGYDEGRSCRASTMPMPRRPPTASFAGTRTIPIPASRSEPAIPQLFGKTDLKIEPVPCR